MLLEIQPAGVAVKDTSAKILKKLSEKPVKDHDRFAMLPVFIFLLLPVLRASRDSVFFLPGHALFFMSAGCMVEAELPRLVRI